MSIKRSLFVLAFSLMSMSAYADVDVVSFRFDQNGSIVDIATTLTPEARSLSTPIVEVDGSLTDPIEEILANEEIGELLVSNEIADELSEDSVEETMGKVEIPVVQLTRAAMTRGVELDEQSNECTQAGGEGTIDSCECPDGGTLILGDDDTYWCCKDNKPYNTTTEVYENEVSVSQCGCKANVSDCTTEALCTAAGYKWCDDGCTTDGSCLKCPEDGEYEKIKDQYCCKDGERYTKLDDEWISERDPENCGCVGDYVRTTADSDSGIALTLCCNPDLTESERYDGMDEDLDAAKSEDERKKIRSNALRVCGCATGTRKRDSEATDNSPVGYVCCVDSDERISDYTKDVLGELSEQDINRYCGCKEGVLNQDGECAPCWTNEDCDSATPYCLHDEGDKSKNQCVVCTPEICATQGKICSTKNGCESCDTSTPYFNAEDQACYECLEDAHCAKNGKKTLCNTVSYTCEVCNFLNNEGCGTGETENKPYCILESGKLLCSECRGDGDCSSDHSFCKRSEGICDKDCGSVGYNPETGSCNCSDDKVWDIYNRQCTFCYNSVGGKWTDFGCNQVTTADKTASGVTGNNSPYNYSPRQEPKEKNQGVCVVEWNEGKEMGSCGECDADFQCSGDKKCKRMVDKTSPAGFIYRCDCNKTSWNSKQEQYYDTNLKMCVDCTLNNGATKPASGGLQCPENRPLCKNNTCTCSANFDTTKKDGDGKCPASAPVCSNGVCKTCTEVDSTKRYYSHQSKQCVACSANSQYRSSIGQCVCDPGYSVAGNEKKCVKSNVPTVKGCDSLVHSDSQDSCRTTVFSFTTVKNMKYKIEFNSNEYATDDYWWITCGGKTKYYCSNDKGCVTGSTASCSAAKGTKACKSNNSDWSSITGDGKTCAMYIKNGYGDCERTACSGATKSIATVSTVIDGYEP